MSLKTFDWDMPNVQLDDVFLTSLGGAFKYTKDPESLFQRIADRKPISLTKFSVIIALPGTSYYSQFGPNTVIVYEKIGTYNPSGTLVATYITYTQLDPANTFSITGINLNTENFITIAPSSNIDIWDGTAYQTSAFTIPYTGNSLTTASIYKVKLKEGKNPVDYPNETVTLSGGGAYVTTVPVQLPDYGVIVDQFGVVAKNILPGELYEVIKFSGFKQVISHTPTFTLIQKID